VVAGSGDYDLDDVDDTATRLALTALERAALTSLETDLAAKADAAAMTTALAGKMASVPVASVSFNGQTITNVGTPTVDTDAVTKGYADAAAEGRKPKDSVLAATTVNVTRSGAQTIDGVALVATNRVLVKNQTAPAENGIYVVAAGAWSRATDGDTWDELVGASTLVTGGTTQANTGWVSQTAAGGTLNTTAITFAQYNASGAASVFGRSGAIVATAGDYTATLITNTPAGGIAATTVQAALNELDTEKAALASPALVSPTRTVQLAAANSSLALADSAYVQGEIGALVAQAVAEAGASTTVVRWTPERVKQAITALAPGVNGAGNALAAAVPSAVTLGATSANETQITSQAITLSNAAAKVLVLASFEGAKDTGTTIRTVTGRVRRGTTNGSTQLGADRSQGVASVPFGPFCWAEVDAPGTVGPHTYTVRGFTDAGTTVTAVRAEIRVIELPAPASSDISSAVATFNGGVFTRTVASHRGDRLSVKDIGTTGTGNDTAVFEDALEYAATVGTVIETGNQQGRRLLVPPGIYDLDTLTIPEGVILEGEHGPSTPSYTFDHGCILRIRSGKASGTHFLTMSTASSLINLGIFGRQETGVDGVKMASDSRIQGCRAIGWGGFGVGNRTDTLIRVIVRDNGFIEGNRAAASYATPQGALHFSDIIDSFIDDNEISAASDYTSFKDVTNRNSIAFYAANLNNVWVTKNLVENGDRVMVVGNLSGSYVAGNRFELALGELVVLGPAVYDSEFVGNILASGGFAANNTYNMLTIDGQVHRTNVVGNKFFNWSHMVAYNKTAKWGIQYSRYPTLSYTTAPLFQGNHFDPAVIATAEFHNEYGSQVQLDGYQQDRGAAAPVAESYPVAWRRWNTAPAAGGTPGWVCTTAGSPGTWKAMASLAA
jgi:hypothetical protein